MIFRREYRWQVYAAVVANFSAFSYGIASGWPSPIIPLLQSPATPLGIPLTVDYTSWIASLSMIGGMIATPIYGWSAERFGRKRTILCTAIPQLLSWALIEVSSSALHLCIARFLVGFGGTGFYLVVPMYVVEISSNKIRGLLGSIMVFSKTLGLVVGFTINSYMPFRTVPFIVMSLLTIFFIGFLFAADSPKHLMTQNRENEAVAALKHFRGFAKADEDFSKDKEFLEELANLKATSATSDPQVPQKLSVKDFTTRSALMGILIGAVMQFLEVLNGSDPIISYCETVFREAGSALPPAMSTIVFAIILLIGTYISSVLVDKAGRRILMLVSTLGCGVNLLGLAAYSYLRKIGVDVTSYDWIPLLCLSIYVLLASVGLISLHMVISSEILAQKIRAAVLSALVTENWMLSFTIVKLFPTLLDLIGLHGCMLMFATVCFGGALFVLFMLPETKGKSVDDIVKSLGGKK